MRKFLLVLLVTGIAYTIPADPVRFEPVYKKMLTLEAFTKEDILQIYVDTGKFPLPPIFDGTKGLGFVLMDNRLFRLNYDTLKPEIHSIISERFSSAEKRVANNDLFIFIDRGAMVYRRLGDRFIVSPVIGFEDRFYYCALLDNLVLLIDDYAETDRYASILVNPDGTTTSMNHEETVQYLLAKGSEYRYENGYLWFKGSSLYNINFDVIDDDGNIYDGVGVTINNKYSQTIMFDSLPVPGTWTSFAFDPEGNFWVTKYEENKEHHPVLYYAGRDWGYREPAREAVTTGNNLRLRLRSNTRAFILETLPEGSPLTVLKTGPEETIGGNRAPWYKVKTKDGIVGWAWGGFLKIAE